MGKRKVKVPIETETHIFRFKDKYWFLSNYYPAEVTVEGLTFPSSENAYQAMKVLEPHRRLMFLSLKPGEARRLTRQIPIREDWDEVKDEVMYKVVKAKFTQNPELAEKLLATGDKILVEGTTWNDTYWGVDLFSPDESSPWKFRGENKLGQILMKVREELRREY
jgi:ribA/ribD-fused uncharacterized protein